MSQLSKFIRCLNCRRLIFIGGVSIIKCPMCKVQIYRDRTSLRIVKEESLEAIVEDIRQKISKALRAEINEMTSPRIGPINADDILSLHFFLESADDRTLWDVLTPSDTKERS
ncbi:hypothetical protein GF382_01010 [Candidatus Falkowbacteria bacterium]|nr:hypothetical protein [Candidatus Falkowbacteria bacterium]